MNPLATNSTSSLAKTNKQIAVPITIMARLREETALEHRAVEKAFNLKSAMNMGGYQSLLLSLYGIYAPFEDVLRGMDLPISMDGRWKTEWLMKDLEHFKIGRIAIDRTGKAKPSLPPLETWEQILGSLYVLEGSTLGGQFIYKALQKRLPVNAERGARFFAGYGQQTHLKWAEFGQEVCTIARLNKLYQEQVVDAARDMFVFVGKRLAKR